MNNLGLNIRQPLESLDLASFEPVVDVNVRTSIQCALAVLPGMRKRGKGRIVNVSSRALLGREGHSSYSAAKAALVGLTRTWALELAPHGITANVVAPGQTATEMFRKDNLIESGARNGRPLEFFTNRIPMRRLGEPDEIAAAIEFFLSESASYVTGQVLYVCGGLLSETSRRNVPPPYRRDTGPSRIGLSLLAHSAVSHIFGFASAILAIAPQRSPDRHKLCNGQAKDHRPWR